MQTFLTYLILILAGWASGALVNYLGDVLPYKRRLAHPFCLHCQKPVGWINYLFWPRRCPECAKRRSIRTWLVEIAFILLALRMWAARPTQVGFYGGLLLLIYFGVVVVIDMEHRLILHPVSIAGAVIGLGIGIWLHGPLSTLIGGAVGFGLMYALYLLGNLFVRIAAKRRGDIAEGDALGFGDVNLTGVLGLMLGWPDLLAGLVVGIFAAAIISIIYLLVMLAARKYQAFQAIPYGPFLVLGAIFVLYLARPA